MAEQFDVLSMFPNNPDPSAQINTGDINAVTLPGYQNMQPNPYSQSVIDAYNSQFAPQAIGPQGAGLYPGLSQDINVGTYSGSIVGANPIFVPSGNILAVDPILARRKAIDDAARAKAASIKPFTPPKTPLTKDPRFQADLSRKANEVISSAWDEATRVYGKDASIVLSDPNTPEGRSLLQKLDVYNTIARDADQIVDLFADARAKMQSGEKTYTPEFMKMLNEFETLTGELEGGDVERLAGLGNRLNVLQGYKSYQDAMADRVKDLQADINQNFYVNEAGDYFRTGTTKKISYDQVIKDLVASQAEGDWGYLVDAGVLDKGFMERTLKSMLRNQTIKEGGIQQKTEATRGAEEMEEQISEFGSDKPGRVEYNVYNPDGSIGGSFSATSLQSYDMNIPGKKHTININEGGKTKEVEVRGIRFDNPVTLNGGKEDPIKGAVYGVVSGVQAVEYVDENGEKKYHTVANARIAQPVTRYYKTKKGEGKRIPAKKGDEGAVAIEEMQETERQIILGEHTQKEVRNSLKTPEAERAWINAVESSNNAKTQAEWNSLKSGESMIINGQRYTKK